MAFKTWLKGAAIAALSMFVYAMALGFFIALTLLVISMEEGGGNLSAASVPLTQAVVLLSEGSGFHSGAITLTLIPLLLTCLLIALIASIAKRLTTSIQAYVVGLLTWLLINYAFSQGVTVILLDPQWLMLLKSGAVFTIGFLLPAVPASTWTAKIMAALHDRIPAQLRRCLGLGAVLGVLLIALYALIGFVTVLVWTVLNHATMGNVFNLMHMQTGSRILTTICSLAWFPNLCIWAASWLFGSGFSIGDLATFTLWVDHSNALPGVPVFGLFPQAVANDSLRTFFVSLPLICALLLAMALLMIRIGFALRSVQADTDIPVPKLLATIIAPAVAFLLATVIVTIGSMLLFMVSNGSLGTGRLKYIGVNVVDSMQSVARPTAMGLFAAWLLAMIVVAGRIAIRWASSHIHENADDAETRRNRKENGVKDADKEDLDGIDEPTDTQGTGIGIS